jgi:hypothetical protein
MRTVTNVAILAAFSAAAPASWAFNSDEVFSSAKFVSTSELDKFTDDFHVIFATDGKADDGNWTLSKVVISDADDLSGPNLTIYSSVVYWEFTRVGFKEEMPVCEAYFGDTKCSQCSRCARYPSSPERPWTVTSGSFFFDCEGIQSKRDCQGTTGSSQDEFEPGTSCDFETGNFRGVETCFVDAISAPTQAPSDMATSVPSNVPSKAPTSGVHARGVALSLFLGVTGWIAVL